MNFLFGNSLITHFLRPILKLYDRNHVLGGIAALFAVIATMLAVVIVMMLFESAFDLGEYTIIIFIPLILYACVFFWAVSALITESMWRTFGIYGIFGIRGRPIRRTIGKWTGEPVDR